MEDSREQDAEKYDSQIKGEVEKALLRMSENRVKAEMRVD